jgi:serine protease AprX
VSYGWGKAVWGTVVALALCTPAQAGPQSSRGHGSGKLDSALQQTGSSDGLLTVIVTAKPGVKPGVRKRAESHGNKVVKDHDIINAMTVQVDESGLAALAADPDVASVSVDADVSPSATTTTTDTTVISDVKRKLALGNWFPGSSVTIAVIDSGIAPTADFSGRIVGTYDFTGGKGGVAISPIDEYGHGTHVAGLAGSSGAISSGYFGGVAPGVKLLSLRVLDKKGAGRTSDVIAAVQFAVANRAKFNIRVINLSLGHPIYESALTDPLVQAVEAAVRAGIVVVVAAGNYGVNPSTGQVGYAGIASPGNAPSALTVGAAANAGTVERTDDRVASFSSKGPSWFDGYAKPDVVAPGFGLLSSEVDGSTLATTYPSLVYPTTNGRLLKLSGSSMATGVVSGLVAIMIEAHDYAAEQRYQSSGRLKKLAPYVPPPALTPNAVKAMLQYSATPLKNANGAKYDALTQGAGEVDGLGAIALAYCADTAALPGTVWMPALPATTTFGTDVEAWSQEIIWGTRLTTGSSLIDINQPAWQPTVVWGAGELANIVWGAMSQESDNIVWGTSAALADVVWSGSVLEGDNIVWGTALGSWGPNIVWGTSLLGALEGDNIVWGTSVGELDNIVWGTMMESDNIVWGTLEFDNIVWGTSNKVTSLGLVGGGQ